MATNKLEKLIQLEDKVRKQREKAFEKAILSNDPNEIIKANLAFSQQVTNKQDFNRKSYIVDPQEFQNSFGYKDRKIALSYNMLKGMARVPVINSVIKTRINQVAAFCEPQKDQYSIGYVIRKKRMPGDISDEKLSKEEEKEIYELTEFVENCGENNVWGNDDFDSFIRKIVRDSLSFDQMCFEVVRNKKGIPVDFYAVDASTTRLADSFDDRDFATYKNVHNLNFKKEQGYYPSYVQLYDSNIHEMFYPWEMCFGVRNPSTDMRNVGYGVSELEDLVTVVTSLVWGEEYNRRFFKQGSAPKGILRISGSMPDGKLAEFRQNWNATMRGVSNSHRTPVLEADKADWIDLQRSNRDMEFTQWIEFLIKITCAIYTIDPAEINFPLSGASGSQPMFDGNNDSRLKFSQNKGLYPMLKFIQKRINKFIISQINPKYEFTFTGMDSLSPKDQMDLDEKRLRTHITINELRKSKNLPPLPNGDTLLDASYMNVVSQAQMAAQTDDSAGYEQGAEGGGESIFEEDSQGDGGEGQESIFEEDNSTEKAENPFTKAINDYINGLNKK